MKIAICGSMKFGKEMLQLKQELEIKGHQVIVPANTESYANGTIDEEGKWEKIQSDVIKSYFEKIKEQDAIFLINKDKNNILNYVGGNSLIEIAFAHVLGKKIFLLNQIPKMAYSGEIEAMEPIVLNGNLNLIDNE